MNARAALVLLALAGTVHAADIGGWMEQKARSDLLIDDCPTLPALAARTPRSADGAAQLYYATGLCYLDSDKLPRDPLAAAAWLRRAANLGHAPARRALEALAKNPP